MGIAPTDTKVIQASDKVVFAPTARPPEKKVEFTKNPVWGAASAQGTPPVNRDSSVVEAALNPATLSLTVLPPNEPTTVPTQSTPMQREALLRNFDTGGSRPKVLKDNSKALFASPSVDVNAIKVRPVDGDWLELSSGKEIAEAGTRLQFINGSTREKTVVTLNGKGELPRGLRLEGKPTDPFLVTQLSTNPTIAPKFEGLIVAPSKLRLLAVGGGELNDGSARFTGPLFVNGVQARDVNQSLRLANCFFAAGVGAIAKANPKAIKNMIVATTHSVGEKTYAVSFKQRAFLTRKIEDVVIPVTSQLYVSANTSTIVLEGNIHSDYKTADSINLSFGGGNAGEGVLKNGQNPRETELWYALVEKAYVTWKGFSYKSFGEGGSVAEVFKDMLGIDTTELKIEELSVDQIWTKINNGLKSHSPMVLGQKPASVPGHAYSILDARVSKDGVRMIRIMDPARVGEEKDSIDGGYNISLDRLKEHYTHLFIGDATRP